jgi:hypothetical protein
MLLPPIELFFIVSRAIVHDESFTTLLVQGSARLTWIISSIPPKWTRIVQIALSTESIIVLKNSEVYFCNGIAGVLYICFG